MTDPILRRQEVTNRKVNSAFVALANLRYINALNNNNNNNNNIDFVAKTSMRLWCELSAWQVSPTKWFEKIRYANKLQAVISQWEQRLLSQLTQTLAMIPISWFPKIFKIFRKFTRPSGLNYYYYYYYTRLTASFSGQPGWPGTRKVKPVWI